MTRKWTRTLLMLLAALSLGARQASAQDCNDGCTTCESGCDATCDAGCDMGCDAGCDLGCADCCDTGCDDCGSGGWIASLEAVYVKPHFSHGVDSAVLVDTDVSNSFPPGNFDPSFDYELTPRLMLGYVNCEGLGARARYWIFDEDGNEVIPPQEAGDPDDQDSIPQPDEFAFVNAELEAQTFDLEITQSACWGRLNANVAAGARIAELDQQRSRVENDNEDFRITNMAFDGVGPTLALDLRRPLACGWTAVANGRGAILFGETDLGFRTGLGDGEREEPSDGDEEADGDLIEDDDMMWIVEYQVGVEYALSVGNGNLALRTVCEAQLWGGSILDGEIIPQSLPSTGGPLTADATATADNNLGFFGVSVGLVYEY